VFVKELELSVLALWQVCLYHSRIGGSTRGRVVGGYTDGSQDDRYDGTNEPLLLAATVGGAPVLIDGNRFISTFLITGPVTCHG
jgi:hypothetical protein